VPSTLSTGTKVQLLTDNGTTVFYADGVAGKDVSPASLQKFRSNVVTLEGSAVPAATLSASTAVAGTSVTASGVGFTPGESIRVTLDGSVLTTDAAASNGTMSTSVTIPASTTAGSHAVTLVGATSGLAESASLTVTTPVVTAPPTPPVTITKLTVTGGSDAGDKLTAHVTDSPSKTTISYRWKRAGVSIAGATKATYTTKAADAGKALTVTVVDAKTGYLSATKTSAKHTMHSVFATSPKPKITGTLRVGHKLTAVTGTWKPTAKLSYRWYRNGHAIKGATHATYTLAKRTAGEKITVRVTGHRSGYTTKSETSAAKRVK
jgi:hypothetical protein